MSTLMMSVADWLTDFATLATIVLAIVLAARWCIRSAAQRMTVAWGGWLGLTALAIVTLMPQWPRFSVLPSAEARIAQPAGGDVSLLQVEELPAEELPVAAETLVESSSPPFFVAGPAGWKQAIVLGWLATVGLAVSWIGLGMAQTWRLLWRCAKAPQWIADELARLVGQGRRAPGLQMSNKLASAAVVGAIRPKIVLPQSVQSESCASTVRAALAHEWAHIRHGDLWLLAIERLLLVLLAWHPLFWWLRREVRLDQELLADAAAAGEQPVEYAEALLTWAKTAGSAPMGLAALSLWESPHTLSRRVTMLLDPNRCVDEPSSRAVKWLLVAGLLTLVGGLSVLTLRPLTADDEAQSVSESAVQTKSDGEFQVKVFELRRGDAGASADMLRALLGAGSSATRPLRLSADRRTNSIVAAGSVDDLEVIRGILTRLDVGPGEPLPPPASFTNLDSAEPQIVLKCTVIEVAEPELASLLPEINSSPQPSPVLAVVVQADEKWQTVFEKLKALRGAQILSQPRLTTLSGQSAQIQIGEQTGRPTGSGEDVIGWKLKLTPELVRKAGTEPTLRLAVEAKQTGRATVHEQNSQGEKKVEGAVVLRDFGTQVTAPAGKVAIVVDRNRRQSKAVVLAIESQVLQADQARAVEPPAARRASANGQPQATQRQLPQVGQPQAIQRQSAQMAQAQAQQQQATDAKHRQDLLRLRQEIDKLLGQTQQHQTQQFQTHPSRAIADAAKVQAAQSAAAREQELAQRNLEQQVEQAAARARSALADAAERLTRIRLMELDRSDAELNLEAARVEVANLEEARQKSPSGISSSQLALAKLAVRRAELQIEKINVQLEGLKRDSAAKGSADRAKQ